MSALGHNDMSQEFNFRHSEGVFLRVEKNHEIAKVIEKGPEVLTMFLERNAGYKEVVDVGIDKWKPACDIINETLLALRCIL